MNFSELKQIVEDAGYSPRSYSGRGMYGRNCLSVNLDRDENEFDLMLDIAESIQSYVETESDGTDLADVTHYFKGAKTDSMGLGEVVYFPNIEWRDEFKKAFCDALDAMEIESDDFDPLEEEDE